MGLRVDCEKLDAQLCGPEFPEFPINPEKWRCVVRGVDDCIYAMPFNAGRILRIHAEREHPENGSESVVDVMYDELSPSERKWRAAVLSPDGCIYAVPYNSGQILRVD